MKRWSVIYQQGLQTGGGKSLVTQTISYQKDGLTIVIVPTISLAIDQKRVTKKVIKRATNEEEIFSYSSGDDVGPIFKAIREQKAKVLFISPERISISLLPYMDKVELENHI